MWKACSICRGICAASSGNDRLHGGRGYDVLVGGAGADELFGGETERNLMFGDAFENPDGWAIDFRPFLGFDLDTLSNIFSFLTDPQKDLSQWSGVNLVGDGKDTIHAEGRLDFVLGGGGDDKLYGRGVLSLLMGNDGNDLIDASLSNYAVAFGGLDNDTIQGGGSNVIFGDGFTHDPTCTEASCDRNQDTITGGEGVNFLIGGTGRDKVYGGGTVDVMFGDTFDLSYPKTITFGKELGDFKISLLGVSVAPIGAGNDLLDGKTGGVDWIVGGDGNDTITGSGVLLGDGIKFDSTVELSLTSIFKTKEEPEEEKEPGEERSRR